MFRQMSETFQSLVAMLLALAAGTAIFLTIANRILTLMRDGPAKKAALLTAFVLSVGSFLAIALVIGGPTRGVLIVGTLFLLLAGECRRLLLRRIHAGSRPVDSVPHPFQLARPFTTTNIVTHRYEIRVPGWRGSSVCIAHISDLHVSDQIPESYFRNVFDLAAETSPDFVFVTGDIISDAAALPIVKRILRRVGRRGIFAVLGNHDYYADAPAVRRTVSEAGIKTLNCESVTAGDSILITGLDHPWGDRGFEVPSAGAGTLHLVLSHTPDNIYRLARTTANCVFSGHLHAGQFRIPHFGPFVAPSVYGRRFDHGHFIVRDTHLFVASGVGASGPAFRIYCQPDIFIIDIKGSGAA